MVRASSLHLSHKAFLARNHFRAEIKQQFKFSRSHSYNQQKYSKIFNKEFSSCFQGCWWQSLEKCKCWNTWKSFFPIMFYACYVFCASRPPTAALWLHLLGIREKSKTQKCSWEGGTSQQAIKQYMCNWKQPNWYGAHKSKQFTLPNSHSSPKLTHHPDTPDILDHLQTIAKYFSNITNADTASTSQLAMLQCDDNNNMRPCGA